MVVDEKVKLMMEIKENITSIIDQSLLDEKMKDLIYSFVDFKENEGFRFGDLVVFHYELFDGHSEEIYKIAAGMELLILAIDIFDDLVDQDNPNPPWMKISAPTATHIAMALLVASQKAIDESQFDDDVKQKAKKIFNDHTLRCIYGQEQDAKNEINSEKDYLIITKEKSGSLISSASLLGTILATKHHIQDVKTYSEHFGIAVQISNDIRDIQRENEKNDFLHKKKTLPVLYVLNQNNPEFEIVKAYYKDKISYDQIKSQQSKIIELIKESGAIEYAKVLMQLEINKSKKVIAQIDIPDELKEKIEAKLFR